VPSYALDRDSVREWDDAIARLEDGAGDVPEFLAAVEQLAKFEDGDDVAGRLEPLQLLGGNWDPVVRPLLVAGLLRLLAARGDVIERKDVRIPFFKALTSWAPEKVFKAAKVKPSEQSYILETALQNSVVETLRRLSEVIATPVGADAIRPYRNSVMKALRAPTATALTEPFLPLQALTTRLDTTFSACEDFLKSSATETIASHERAMVELSRYKAELGAWGTRYANEYLIPLVDGLASAVREHFAASSESKPALLQVRGSEKRYPLGDTGRRFDAVAIIRNVGEGRAEEALMRISESNGNVMSRSP
jgi:hypothetical protein